MKPGQTTRSDRKETAVFGALMTAFLAGSPLVEGLAAAGFAAALAATGRLARHHAGRRRAA